MIIAASIKKKKKIFFFSLRGKFSSGQNWWFCRSSRGRASESRKICFPSRVGSMSLAYTFELKPLFSKVPASHGELYSWTEKVQPIVGYDQS